MLIAERSVKDTECTTRRGQDAYAPCADDHGMRLLLGSFSPRGVSVLTAATGTEALDKLRLKRPDLCYQT